MSELERPAVGSLDGTLYKVESLTKSRDDLVYPTQTFRGEMTLSVGGEDLACGLARVRQETSFKYGSLADKHWRQQITTMDSCPIPETVNVCSAILRSGPVRFGIWRV